jgi:hypothetical protein
MTDTAGYPAETQQAAPPPPAPADPVAVAKERAQAMFDELKPYAQREYRAYFINHAPKEVADAMRDLVEAESPEDALAPLPKGPPSDPPTENAIGQYAAMRAAATAAEGKKDEVRAEIKKAGPGAEQPPTAAAEAAPQPGYAQPYDAGQYDPNQPHQ